MTRTRAVVVALSLLALAGCGGDSEAATPAPEQAQSAEPTPARIDRAYDFCIEQITEQLKAPATAEFSERNDEQEAADGDRRFLFTGTVDSQNGFGALIRSDWACDISWSPSAGFAADVATLD